LAKFLSALDVEGLWFRQADDMVMRIYLTNLAKYNEGILKGKWVDLPLDDEDLNSEIKSVLGQDEEYFITDYESPFSLSEYENIHDLNSLASKLEELDGHDTEKVAYLLEHVGLDRNEALEQYEDVDFYPNMTLSDVAEEMVEEGLFGEIPENIKPYLDFEKIGRDLSFDGYHETKKGTFFFR